MPQRFKRFEPAQYNVLPETLPIGTVYNLNGICTLLEPSTRSEKGYPAVRRTHESRELPGDRAGYMLERWCQPEWIDIPTEAPSEPEPSVPADAPQPRTCKKCKATVLAGDFCVYCDARVNGEARSVVDMDARAARRMQRALALDKPTQTRATRELAKAHPWDSEDVDSV